MKSALSLFTLSLLLFISCTSFPEQEENKIHEYKYEYRQFDNDPYNVLEYTLSNGLKVFMSLNPEEPRISTNIVVKAGSKNDPSDATGLAHYLEHMLFKGTSQIGSKDWDTEKELLKQISDTYEQRRTVTDDGERKQLYALIDSLSVEAAKYCIPNEYDKMISSLGAKGTNAYTSLERTVYTNDIPSNELERWLMVESERFSELVLRLFHTELEAVYEEFNIGQDSDYRAANKALMEALFKKHSYGTQTTIGTGEHLKNPSMEKIHEFFTTYYVPNNMAIVLAGDIDPDRTVDLITKYFGNFESKEVPEFTPPQEDPIDSVEIYDVYGRDREWVTIAFRLPGVNSEDIPAAQMTANILSNGSSGLMDLNLLKDQKILSGWVYPGVYKDYSSFELVGNPREGQSLEEVRDLLLSEVQKVRNGEFEDWLLPAVMKAYKLQEYLSNQNNVNRSYYISNAFILEQDWQTVVDNISKLSELTKENIVDFANRYLKDNNYVVVNKFNGESNPYKVEKPEITEIDLNRSVESEFMSKFNETEADRIEPQFINYSEEVRVDSLTSGIELSYVENKLSPTFELRYILEMGFLNDKDISLATQYLEYIGTDEYSASELEQEFYKLGVKFGVYTSPDRLYVSLYGLEDSLEAGIRLFEHVIEKAQADQSAYDKFVEGKLKKRKDAKLSKYRILRSAMNDYARYGSDNPYKHIIPEESLKQKDVNQLVEQIRNISNFKHEVYYYGQKEMDEVVQLLNEHHKTAPDLNDVPDKKIFTELPTNENTVYFTHFDMVQVEMMMKSNAGKYNPKTEAISKLFNEYFGSGLSSIVFQEIRESRALAYSAYAYYSNPGDTNKNHYVNAYIGAQTDKLPDAVDAMLEIMNNMPEAEDQFNQAKEAALKKIESSRVGRDSYFWIMRTKERMNKDTNHEERVYNEMKKLTFEDMKTFYNETINGRDYTFLVLGDRNKVDMKKLELLGPVKELSLEELFGY